ncbi:hypothetical protein M3Y96_01148400 [Aphelenchoides besseyi]|nr:hypothetical protein M3Y96_01148400 [Aphelenchoides besseyi]
MAAYGGLTENSTFSRSERSLVSALDSMGAAYMCNTHGTEDRFVIVFESDRRINWIVDTFNDTKKEIHVDFSAIGEQNKPDGCGLETLYFIDSSTVCGIVFTGTYSRRYWFNGKFDMDFVLRINTINYLGELHFTLNTRAQPTTLNAHSIHHLYSHTVDLANGNLSELKVTNMPYDLWSPTVRDVDEKTIVNTKTLYEISLIDASKTEHEVKEEINVEIRNSLVPSLWTNTKLLTRIFDRNTYVSTVVKFDISQMKWEKTTIEVEGRIESMTLNDGLLIVYAFNWKNELEPFGYDAREMEFRQVIYRFQYEAVDSLANMMWLSMQRHSVQNPNFHEGFLSQVPKNYRLRPLWDSRKND